MSKFVADTMLGTLAKWLRIAGIDTAYLPHAEDDEIIALAAAEGRIILTRDRDLASRAPPGAAVVLPDGTLEEQISFLRAGLEIKPEDPLSRCILCNTMLVRVPRSEVEHKVPSQVFDRERVFWRCTQCARIYWPASHYDAMRRRLQVLFPSSE
ncbi:MAG: Mut7-C RNAse domain-containing protein [Candidatus Thermoplasmatota archaeon]